MFEDLVPELLGGLAERLRSLQGSGHFSAAWLTDGSHNKGGWLHARLWAALTQSVPQRFVPNLEVRLSTPGRQESSYKPDVVICDRADRLILAVEIESTNSSDGRVVYRDIDRITYLSKAPAEERPLGVLLLTVLPSRRVINLPMYDGHCLEERERRRNNPYEFHQGEYIAALDAARVKCAPLSVVWANIDVDAIHLEYWNGAYKKRRNWPLSLQ